MSQTIARTRHARPRFTYESLLHLLLWAGMILCSYELTAPAPFDLFVVAMIPVWFFTRFHVHRVLIVFVFLMLMRFGIEALALVPYVNEPDPYTYVYYSLVCTIFGLFFAFLMSDNTEERMHIFLHGYYISCLIAALAGILGYLHVAGTAKYFTMDEGRASGTFLDANVLGSYLVLGALYAFQRTLLARGAAQIGMGAGFLFICIGVLFSFSRGSWGALIVTVILLAFMTFATAGSRMDRRKIGKVFIIMLLVAVAALLALMADESIRTFLLQRAKLLHSYDSGATGRFGNQARSLPMLLNRPMGFGPLRFRLIFVHEPHDSYISAFANAGWIGGFVFILLAMITNFVGARLCFTRSPYQRLAQVVWPATLAHFLQGFQIDIDHWRFLYAVMGALWGLEAARQRWLAHTLRAGARAQLASDAQPVLQG